MSKTVVQHLIGVTVTIGTHGIPKYAYASLLGSPNPSNIPTTLIVGPGDQVAWQVLVIDQNNNFSYPRYDLTFSSPSLFGTGSLAVPGGNFSPFLQVLSLTGNTKYTLTVSGINPPSDPTIEIDPGQIFTKKKFEDAEGKP